MSNRCDVSGQCTCNNKYYGKQFRDRNCEVSNWSSWSECQCGRRPADSKTRTRSITTTFLGNGRRCPALGENGQCPEQPCDCNRIRPGYHGFACENRDCQLGDWSGWNTCSQRCPSGSCWEEDCRDPPAGTRSRHRGVSVSKEGNGRDCSSNRHESVTCTHCVKKCKIAFEWSDGAWYKCEYKVKG